MNLQTEVLLIGIIVSLMCSIPGTFLLLKRMSMAIDSITHSVLLGIVIAFLIVKDLSSPWLMFGATLSGVITLWLSEWLAQSNLVSEDSSIGLVFPFLFSIAVILISKYAGSVHLCTDSVLLGELAFAPFDRIYFGSLSLPRSLMVGLIILLINLLLSIVFYKELKLSTFDSISASLMGFTPSIIHYGLVTITSLTAVGAFQAVGSILVISFMIAPVSTMRFISDDLKTIIFGSMIVGVLNATIGYFLAMNLDTSISGTMAFISGCTFMIVWVFAPKKGLISKNITKHNNKYDFMSLTLLFHVLQHQNTINEKVENKLETLDKHLCWNINKTNEIVNDLNKKGLIKIEEGYVYITGLGKKLVEDKLINL